MSRILKAGAVKIDIDNTISLDYFLKSAKVEPADKPEEVEESEKTEKPEKPAEQKEDPKETARQIIQIARHEAEKTAKSIVDNAKVDSIQIQAEAKRQAEADSAQIRTQAREEGYQEGYQKGKAEGDAIISQANSLLTEAKQEREAMQRSLEPDIVELITKIVTKLLSDTVRIDPAVILNLIRQGLANATITGDVFIHVSQHDFEQVTKYKDELLAMADGSVKMEIIRDLSLNAMDCVIETPFGNIDCSLNPQLDALLANLNYILKNRDSE